MESNCERSSIMVGGGGGDEIDEEEEHRGVGALSGTWAK